MKLCKLAVGPACLCLTLTALADVSRANEPVFPEMQKIWEREPVADSSSPSEPTQKYFRRAEKNARLANQAFFRCRRYIDGWLAHCDPETGLFPRNFRESRDFWNGRDCAADNYPFMVLTAAMTDRPLMNGRLLDILHTEIRLTSRLGRLPDDYSFSKRGWRREKLNLDEIIFDGAEYVKDGLLYIAEWMGPNGWLASRMTFGVMRQSIRLRAKSRPGILRCAVTCCSRARGSTGSPASGVSGLGVTPGRLLPPRH